MPSRDGGRLGFPRILIPDPTLDLRMKRHVLLIFLGGLAVVLPAALVLMVMQWLFVLVTDLLRPLTQLLSREAGLNELVALVAVAALMLATCFSVGLAVRTRIGRWLHEVVDAGLAKVVPGYRTTSGLVRELLGRGETSRALSGDPALARIHGLDSPVQVTAIVTSRHADGGYTVYVPTAPFPTSGFIYHLPPECVELLPGVSLEAVLRTVIACGAGSAEVLAKRASTVVRTLSTGSVSEPGSGSAPD
jgi:uncharacterized membrane protein